MKRSFQSALLLLLAFSLQACDSSGDDKGELVVTDLVEGSGALIEPGMTLITEYVGRFADGSQFDSSDELGEDWIFTLGVGQVLQGWDEGLSGMRVGGTRRLEIPSHMAFGRNGQCFSDGTCAVPPNTDVIYDVTVIDIFDEVIIEEIVEGDGEVAAAGDVLFVEYTGQLRNGQVFDSTNLTGTLFQFTLGRGSVIPGWDQGMPGMKVGGTRRLTIPPVLAYGPYGAGAAVPPFAVLIFEVTLVELVKAPS
ncbi:MAG: FKBP-type peptidyl-prolyl cis-trans isomerase [Rhodothermales bacterium]